MKIYVTGGSGFVGQNVLKRIQKNDHLILALTPDIVPDIDKDKNLTWLHGNMENLKNLKSEIKTFDPDIVIHLAWQGIPDYSEMISMFNLKYSIELLNFILDETSCKKIVVAGSCFEYGKKFGSCNEEDCTQINSFFSWAKQSLYNYLLLKCKYLQKTLIWFRIFYIYGIGQRREALIPAIVSSFLKGEYPRINNPFNKNDFIYAEDVAEAFQLASIKDIPSGIYNIGSGISCSVYEVCRNVEVLIRGNGNLTEQVIEGKNIKEEFNFWADISKTKNILGWSPKTSLNIGIKHYIDDVKITG